MVSLSQGDIATRFSAGDHAIDALGRLESYSELPRQNVFVVPIEHIPHEPAQPQLLPNEIDDVVN